MKQVLAITLLFMTTFHVNAQKLDASKIPADVMNGFKSKYAETKHVTWSLGDNNNYEVDFEKDSTVYTATFNEHGKWLKTEHDVEQDDLPSAVKAAVAKKYDGYAITDAEFIDSHDQGKLYGLHIEKGEDTQILYVNDDGKIVKQEKEDNED
jgi:hypothetical protein